MAHASPCPTDLDTLGCGGPPGQTCSELMYQDVPPRFLTDVAPPTTTWCDGTPNRAGCGASKVWTPNESYLPDEDILKDSLFVFLPATGGLPEGNEWVQAMAAFAGYRTIGVAYYNRFKLDYWCTGDAAADGFGPPPCQDAADNSCHATQYWRECGYKMQMERFTGVDYCTPDPIVMDRKNAIAYRLLLALNQAKAADLANGDEDGDGDANDWQFGQYCVNAACPIGNPPPEGLEYMDRIRWDKVVLGGFSQGAGYPVLWSLVRDLRGIVPVDGGNPLCGGGTQLASYLSAIPALYGNTAGASQGPYEVGLFHADRPWGSYPDGEIPPAWTTVELGTTWQNLDTDNAPYWNLGRDVERTAQKNVANTVDDDEEGPAAGPNHGSMAFDAQMPDEATWNLGSQGNAAGVDLLENVWRLHVFERYVAGFCNAGD